MMRTALLVAVLGQGRVPGYRRTFLSSIAACTLLFLNYISTSFKENTFISKFKTFCCRFCFYSSLNTHNLIDCSDISEQ